MSVKQIKAIDVHAHYGMYFREHTHTLANQMMSADEKTVFRRAIEANTELTFVSPLRALMPRMKGNPVRGNNEAFAVIRDCEGLRQWVVIDPLKPETYSQASEMLSDAQCVGIKIHPEEHGYPIAEHGKQIFEFAQQHQTIIKTHSGEQNSMPEDFVDYANAFQSVTVILAHLGLGWDGDPSHQVRAIQASRHSNLYTDTSSARSLLPGLIEWAVREVGEDRILYGTDSPLYDAPMQRARVDHAQISDGAKRKTLRDNALSVFKEVLVHAPA